MTSWALKLFTEICCDGCMCRSEKDHSTDKDLGDALTSSRFPVEDEHTSEQPH